MGSERCFAGGLVYSVLALTLSTKPVYASGCDCSEALQDANELCYDHHWGFFLSFIRLTGS
jgi:hypothetical protein